MLFCVGLRKKVGCRHGLRKCLDFTGGEEGTIKKLE